MYSQNDYRDYLEHSWGKKPEQKAAEKAYNQKYYQEHKEKWKKYKENVSDALGFDDKKQLEDAESEFKEVDKQLSDLAQQINSYKGDLTPQQKKELQKLYDEYYQVLDKHKAASSKAFEARENYEKNGSLAKIIDDGAAKTAKRAIDAVDNKVSETIWDTQDKLGVTSKYRVKSAKKDYERTNKIFGQYDDEFSKSEVARDRQKYEKELSKHYKTPIGKVDKFVDAGKMAMNEFSEYMKKH